MSDKNETTAPDLNLAAIKARLAAATPGPWATNRVLVTVGAPCRWCSFVVRPDVPPAYDISVATPGHGTSMGDESPDADLIAHAPTDLTVLVAEVDRLRAVEAAARDLLESAGQDHYRATVLLRAALEAK